ncbi:hypothetical protein LTR53_013167 [Teratosphaeriaceae sp. CCFEE 6253]|nr:hypothetical protein LTR53_013167 [Teratosphaeriaceae sp. CCFEE 6253]
MPRTRPDKLAGKHILLFGGTSGIGFAVAEAILASSPTSKITISSSSQAKIDAKIRDLQDSFPDSTITGYACDLSSVEVEQSIATLFTKAGTVDHIIVTSGDAISRASVHDSTVESIKAAGQVRFVAPILIAKIGSKYLTLGPASSIIFTGAVVGQRPMEGWTVVAGYAAAIEGVTRNLALDLKPVRVNCVAPGPVETELFTGMSEAQRSGAIAMAEKTPVGRLGQPEDIAECYLWLMKDANVTGFVACSDAGSKLG